MSQTIQFILSGVIVFILTCLAISLSQKSSPSQYVSTVYLYTALAIAISSLSAVHTSRLKYTPSLVSAILLFFFSLFLIFGIGSFQNPLSRNLFFVLFAVSIGVMGSSMYGEQKDKGVLASTIVSTLVLVFGLSIYSFYSTRDFMSMGKYLFFGLIALIVFGVIDLVLNRGSMRGSRVFSVVAVVLFSGFLLFDTQRIRNNSLNLMKNPNYPNDSLGVFLDVANLFSNVSNLN